MIAHRLRSFSLALALAAAAPLLAQPASPSLAGIAHVAIRVSSLQASRAFYHQLGFEEAFAMNKGGNPTEAFFKINNRQFIELYPRSRPSLGVGFMHICFEASDINAVHQDYVNHGLTPKAVIRAGAGNLLFTLQGPDEPGPHSDLRPAATQNIEYTQYMPGSRHTLDRGKHLGPNRIAQRIAGVGIPMADAAAATAFYEHQLSFSPSAQPLEPGQSALALPGAAGERVELLPPPASAADRLPFRLILAVPSLRRTKKYLRQLRISFRSRRSEIVIHDPDGNAIVFIRGAAV